MSKKVLITAATEDVEMVLADLREKELSILHFPLEIYEPIEDQADIESELNSLEEYENIVYGNLRNARFFLDWAKEFGKVEEVRKRLNLTLDQTTADLMEQEGIPAICTHGEKKPINLIEFMLRLRRLGATLYPCGTHKKEEVPGFLEELDIPVRELELYKLEGPQDDKLKEFQSKLNREDPDIVLFHSRRSVTRTLTAFPDLDYESIRIISADTGITKKLKDNELEMNEQAKGSWESMAALI